jgi:hypothetical protein
MKITCLLDMLNSLWMVEIKSITKILDRMDCCRNFKDMGALQSSINIYQLARVCFKCKN